MKRRNDLPAKRPRGHLLDARLHLLDRQLLNDDGDPTGIVDDLELNGVEFDRDITEGADAPRVTGLLSGKVVATRIFGGSPPRSRLQEIPWDLVASVGVVVRLKQTFREVEMQLSDLLGLRVTDAGSHTLGTVVDVRLTTAGDPAENPPAPRVQGLVVSPRTRSSYLGSERSDARAPVMLAVLSRWLHCGTFLAAWEDVARVGRDQVKLRPNYTRYSAVLHDTA
jgi:sporulation protein YlmC with PRC-barrel domain